ncbi:MAG: hypothetical protein ACQEP3_01750 [Patescibacteria group bacterium]
MKVVNGELFNRAEEDFSKDISVVEIIDDQSITWRDFKADDVVINCKGDCREVSINLDGGVIDGNLTLTGLHQKLNSIKLIDIKAQKVAIYNVEAEKIEITGNIEIIEMVNCSADDYHICGEIEESILLFKAGSRTSVFEFNGYASSVKLKNVIADDFKLTSFEFNKLQGEDIKIKKLHLPTDWKSELKFINIKELHLFKSGEATGVIYDLRNSKLEF